MIMTVDRPGKKPRSEWMHATRTIRWLLTILTAAAIASVGEAQSTRIAEPLPGISTSGQPDASTLAKLAEDGYVAIIDLRTPKENRGLDERKAVEELGMSYISLPVDGPDGVTYENAAVLDAILDETGRPVLIHCSTGNRAGALLALRHRLSGAAAGESLEVGIAAGVTGLRSVVEARLAEPPAE